MDGTGRNRHQCHLISVHPGGIDTDIARNARFYKAANPALDQKATVRLFGKVARTSPDQAAWVIIKGIKKKKKRVLIGWDARFMALAKRLSPIGTVMRTGWLMTRAR